MNSILRGLIVFFFMLIVTLSPICVYRFYQNAKTIIFSTESVKKKIKVDSVKIETYTSSDGGGGLIYYNLYNVKHNIKISLLDNDNSIWKYLGEDNLPSHAMNCMRNHNDSVWVWYNPGAEIKYAKEEEIYFPIKREIVYLMLNGAVIALAVYAIKWQIRYNRKKKQNHINS